jgi:hypothetical protein
VGRPGLEPGTLGLKVLSLRFHGPPMFVNIGHDLLIYSHRSSALAEIRREL